MPDLVFYASSAFSLALQGAAVIFEGGTTEKSVGGNLKSQNKPLFAIGCFFLAP